MSDRRNPSSAALEARGLRRILLGVLVTLALIAGRVLLPPRTLDLTAAAGGYAATLEQVPDGPLHDAVRWVDARRLALHCRYDTPADWQPCGVTFRLWRKTAAEGVDLRGYRKVVVDVRHRGEGGTVVLSIRTFDRRFSRVADWNSHRPQALRLRARDLQAPLEFDLDELTVPDWWVYQYDLPHAYNRPGLENATWLTVGVSGNLTGRDQDLELRSLVLEGEWISAETLYLAILSAWMVAIAAGVGWRLVRLHGEHRRQAREIEALVARTAQLNSEQDSLRRLATLDPLTGVLNRRGVEQAMEGAAASGRPVALLLLDIDHFKHVNDRHGHDAGDQVLRRVAAVLVQNVRGGDIVGRWGGEEFLAACVDCPLHRATAVAETIRQRIETSTFGGSRRIPVTASVGVAMLAPGEDLAAAFRRADAALYQAKAGGRNQVVVDGERAGQPS